MAGIQAWGRVVLLMTGWWWGGGGDNYAHSIHSSFAEMICAGCVARLPYLQFYSGLAVSKVEKEDAGADAAVNVEKGEGAAKEVIENVEPLAKSGVDVPADANASSGGFFFSSA